MVINAPFDLVDLTLIAHIGQTGSLSAAAALLGVSPAAASRRLSALETRLGARLFARTTRRLRATAEGEAFLPHAERIIAAAAEAQAALPGGTSLAAVSGTLRLTAPATFGRKVLAPMVSALLRDHPALRLDLLLTDSVVDLVEARRDAAVRIAPLVGQTLVARKLALNHRVLCAAPAYLARRGVPMAASDLAGHDGLVLQGNEAWRLTPPEGGAARKVRPVPRIVSNSNEALREACLAGQGIGLHSTWDVGDHLRSGALVALPESLGAPEQLGIWLVMPGGVMPARVRALADLLTRGLGQMPAWRVSAEA